MSSLGRMAARATRRTQKGKRDTLKRWLLCRCLAVTLIAGALTSFGLAVVTAPAAAGKFANYFSLNPCKILPSSDIAAIIGAKSTHQIILDLNTYACGWSTGHQTADVTAALSVAIVEEATENNYAEAGVSVSPVAGLPANLVVFSATALQPNLVARAHVQFSVPIKGRYWEVQGESGSSAQLEKLARELYAALGGEGNTLTTIQSASQQEAIDMKQFIVNIQAGGKTEAKEECEMDEAIAGSSAAACSGVAAPDVVKAYVQELQEDQTKLAAELAFIDQSGHSVESVGAAVQAAQQLVSALTSLLPKAGTGAKGVLGNLESSVGSSSKPVRGAMIAIANLNALLTAKEEQLNIQPSPTSEASNAAGF